MRLLQGMNRTRMWSSENGWQGDCSFAEFMIVLSTRRVFVT